MKKYFMPLLAILFLNFSWVLGDDCSMLSKIELYKYSDLIAIGKVEHYDDQFYYISIQELFKGESDSIIVVDKESAPSFQKSKYWLIYASERDGIIRIPPCSGTKAFNMPFGRPQDLHRVKIPPSHVLQDKTLYYLFESNILNNSINELILEIMSLRQMRLQNQISSLQDSFLTTIEGDHILQEQYSKIKNQNSIIIGILILVNAIIFVFILTQLFRIFKGNASHTS